MATNGQMRELGKVSLPTKATTLSMLLETFSREEPDATVRLYGANLLVEAPALTLSGVQPVQGGTPGPGAPEAQHVALAEGDGTGNGRA